MTPHRPGACTLDTRFLANVFADANVFPLEIDAAKKNSADTATSGGEI